MTGLNEEFISGARLDNLIGTYAAIIGLVESLDNEEAFASDKNVRIAACFDNEEVGRKTEKGIKER